MKGYKHSKNCWKVETSNAVIIITDNLTDILGRNITSVQIKPDNYAGEPKNKRIGGCGNVRVVTLKKK